jgi:hypothetical protein
MALATTKKPRHLTPKRNKSHQDGGVPFMKLEINERCQKSLVNF